MSTNDTDLQAVARERARYRLAPPSRPPGARAGERPTRGLGSSSEFHELREYRLGDDIRRIDWRSSMRTDRWMLRLHREEIEPRLEVLVDVSKSMAVESVKALRLRELVALLHGVAEDSGYRVRARAVGREGHLDLDGARGELALDGTLDLLESLRRQPLPTAGHPWRIVISDFLFPFDPRQLVARLAAGAPRLSFVQLLTTQELRPELHGFYRLVDAESAAEKMTAVGAAEVQRYQERLRRWNAALTEAAGRHGAQHLLLEADRPLAALARDVLLPAGILVPSGGPG